ncbi:hypothetical protein QTH47_12770 [Clostridium perfringens]|nr:hypothetical protein [Clostridium perfringens]
MKLKTVYLKVEILTDDEELIENPMDCISVDADGDYAYIDYEEIKNIEEE